MNENLSKQLDAYLSFFPIEEPAMQGLATELQSKKDLFSRKTVPGHITASGIVVTKNRLLMIRHPGLGKWLQPGGHVENGETPLQAAIREVEEETGMPSRLHPWHHLRQFPVDIDIHEIPANDKKSEPRHLHYDFRYLLRGALLPAQGEHPAAWKEITSIEEKGLANLVRKIGGLKISE
jgi:8-oxo-dGTP pyrophosphatase MutT (NUDIX family)